MMNSAEFVEVYVVAERSTLAGHEAFPVDLDRAVEDVAMGELHPLAMHDAVCVIPCVELGRRRQAGKSRAAGTLELDDDVVGRILGGAFDQHVVARQSERRGALAMPDADILDLQLPRPLRRLEALGWTEKRWEDRRVP